MQKSSYEVLVNSDADENNKTYVGAGLVPDLILIDRVNQKPAFIIEVRKNGNIGICLDQWKTLSSALPLYLIVPSKDLSTAKSLAIIKNVKTKFGTYKIEDNNVTVDYE